MITVTDTKGQKHHLALEAIARVSEASAACRWHGALHHRSAGYYEVTETGSAMLEAAIKGEGRAA